MVSEDTGIGAESGCGNPFATPVTQESARDGVDFDSSRTPPQGPEGAPGATADPSAPPSRSTPACGDCFGRPRRGLPLPLVALLGVLASAGVPFELRRLDDDDGIPVDFGDDGEEADPVIAAELRRAFEVDRIGALDRRHAHTLGAAGAYRLAAATIANELHELGEAVST